MIKLFSTLEKNKFEEQLRLSNLKEKNYIEVISQLNAEYQDFKSKAAAEITKLKNELKKHTNPGK